MNRIDEMVESILDVSSEKKVWLVTLSAGMPGGIGDTGYEFGGVTSPLVLLGIRYGLRQIDRGDQLSKWFVKEYGSTQCQAITQCDFSNPEGARKYMDDDRITGCKEIAIKVAEKVQQILQTGTSIVNEDGRSI